MKYSIKHPLKTITLATCALVLSACDPEGRKECAWVLEPEPTLQAKVQSGYIPVCARNRTTQKQDCRLQTTLEYAKKVHEKVFRYVDLEVEHPGIPRTVKRIKFCNGDNE